MTSMPLSKYQDLGNSFWSGQYVSICRTKVTMNYSNIREIWKIVFKLWLVISENDKLNIILAENTA